MASTILVAPGFMHIDSWHKKYLSIYFIPGPEPLNVVSTDSPSPLREDYT